MIIGIGIDVADVTRYRFEPEKLAWFARKIYTPDEMAYAMRKRNRDERLAGFFAAKEAARKAFGHSIPWRQIGVTHESSGRPTLAFFDEAAGLIAKRTIRIVHLTITHTAATAAAVVILES